ncbi:MAG: DUF6492 family protein [Chthoniobacter sp.]
MPTRDLRHHPLDVVTACRAADLRVLQLTSAALKKYVPLRRLHVVTAPSNFRQFRRALGEEVALVDEDTFIPGMTLEALRQLSLPGFPRGAGWYFQQLLKLNFCFHELQEEYYLIWDADTVPLRPLEFFNEQGAMLLATAEEEHPPYFETYRKLLGHDPHREFSFIAQHILVQKSILREMLEIIEQRFPGDGNWAWKIMRNLEGTGTNLFSEYEMYGHYVKNRYPDRAVYRQLPWLREGSRAVRGIPSSKDLDRLGRDYAFAAFESSQRFLRRWVRWLRTKLGR